MLVVTERAARYFLQVLDSRQENSAQILRIVPRGDSYELTLDDSQESDQVFEHEGRSYLLVAPEVLESLPNGTLDIHETAEGIPPRITLNTG